MTISLQARMTRLLSNERTPLAFWLLSLLFVAAFLIRIWGISKAHFWDEMVYLQNAQVICCGKINYSELDFRPPLISIFYAGAFLLWHNIYSACIVAALVNALGPVFLYLAGRLSVGRLPAAIAAMILAFGPFFVGIFPNGFDSDDTGNSLLTDSPALTIVILAFWLLLRALRRESIRLFFFAGIVLAMSVLMRFGSLPTVGMLFLLPLLSRRPWDALIACGSGLLLGIAPYLAWSRAAYGGFLFTLRAGWAHVEGPEPPFTFFLRNFATIFTPLAAVGFVIALVAMLWGIVRRPPHPRAAQIGVIAFLWIWFLAGFLFFSTMPHKEPRYIMPLAPPVLLLAGSGLAFFRAFRSGRFITAGTLLLAALLVLDFLPLRERLRKPFVDPVTPYEVTASQYLQEKLLPGTILYMNFNYPVFAFYTDFRIAELPALGPALYQRIEQIPPGGVLIAYRTTSEVWAPDIAWVDANPKFQRLRDFSQFVVYRRVAESTRQ